MDSMTEKLLVDVSKTLNDEALRQELAETAGKIGEGSFRISDELFDVLVGFSSIGSFVEWITANANPDIALVPGHVRHRTMRMAQTYALFTLIKKGLVPEENQRARLLMMYRQTLEMVNGVENPDEHVMRAIGLLKDSLERAFVRIAPSMTDEEIEVLAPFLAPTLRIDLVDNVEKEAKATGQELGIKRRNTLFTVLSSILQDQSLDAEFRKDAFVIQQRLRPKVFAPKAGPQMGPKPKKPILR